MKVTWYCNVIEMHCTSANPRQEATQEGFFLIAEWQNPKKQWGGIKHHPNNQSGYDIGNRIRNQRILCKFPRSHTIKNSTHWNGSSTTENTNADQQLGCTLICNEHYPAKKNKVNGLALTLAEVSRRTWEFQILLEIREKELGRQPEKSTT